MIKTSRHPARARRAVLIVPRGPGESATSLRAMDEAMRMISAAGYQLAGVMDPKDHQEALRMVVDGRVDVVVATRPDHVPTVRFIADAAWFRRGVFGTSNAPSGGQRSRPMLRPADQPRQGDVGRIDAAGLAQTPDTDPGPRRTQIIRRDTPTVTTADGRPVPPMRRRPRPLDPGQSDQAMTRRTQRVDRIPPVEEPEPGDLSATEADQEPKSPRLLVTSRSAEKSELPVRTSASEVTDAEPEPPEPDPRPAPRTPARRRASESHRSRRQRGRTRA